MFFSEFFFSLSLLLWLKTAIKGKITCSKYQTGSVLSEKDPGKDEVGAKTEKKHSREETATNLPRLCATVFHILHWTYFFWVSQPYLFFPSSPVSAHYLSEMETMTL